MAEQEDVRARPGLLEAIVEVLYLIGDKWREVLKVSKATLDKLQSRSKGECRR